MKTRKPLFALIVVLIQIVIAFTVFQIADYIRAYFANNTHNDVAWGLTLHFAVRIYVGIVLLTNILLVLRQLKKHIFLINCISMLVFGVLLFTSFLYYPYRTLTIFFAACVGIFFPYILSKLWPKLNFYSH